jgi:hypothetical protein
MSLRYLTGPALTVAAPITHENTKTRKHEILTICLLRGFVVSWFRAGPVHHLLT